MGSLCADVTEKENMSSTCVVDRMKHRQLDTDWPVKRSLHGAAFI